MNKSVTQKLLLFFFLLLAVPTGILAQCLEGDCENGEGVYKCDCGYIFEGTFANGQKQFGKLIKEEVTYIGPFKDDMAHGKGKMIRNNGSIYEGDFAFSSAHGWGSFYLVNGLRYTGEINAGKYDGWGLLQDSNHTILATSVGQFARGEQLGITILHDSVQGFIIGNQSGIKDGLHGEIKWEGTILIFSPDFSTVSVKSFKKGKEKAVFHLDENLLNQQFTTAEGDQASIKSVKSDNNKEVTLELVLDNQKVKIQYFSENQDIFIEENTNKYRWNVKTHSFQKILP